MSEPKFYTDRSNARRAAERLLEKGDSPAVDYNILERKPGRYEIVWKVGAASSATPEPAGAAEQASQDATSLQAEPEAEPVPPVQEPDQPAPITEPDAGQVEQASPRAQAMADKLNAEAAAEQAPAATMAMKLADWYIAQCAALTTPGKAKVTWLPSVDVLSEAERLGKHKVTSINRKNVIVFEDGSTMSLADEPPRKASKPRSIGPTTDAKSESGWGKGATADAVAKAAEAEGDKAPSRARGTGTPAGTKTRASKAAPLAAGPDGLPVKPVITSAANASYQGRLDKLAEMAGAGDWAGVEAYEVKGQNTYAKVVARYRDALLAARPAAKSGAA